MENSKCRSYLPSTAGSAPAPAGAGGQTGSRFRRSDGFRSPERAAHSAAYGGTCGDRHNGEDELIRPLQRVMTSCRVTIYAVAPSIRPPARSMNRRCPAFRIVGKRCQPIFWAETSAAHCPAPARPDGRLIAASVDRPARSKGLPRNGSDA